MYSLYMELKLTLTYVKYLPNESVSVYESYEFINGPLEGVDVHCKFGSITFNICLESKVNQLKTCPESTKNFELY